MTQYLEVAGFKIGFAFNESNPGYTVYDSYKANDKVTIQKVLNELWLTKDYYELCRCFKYSRTENEQLEEWLAHSILYNLHILRSRTKDSDIHQNEPLFRKVGYKLLCLFHK